MSHDRPVLGVLKRGFRVYKFSNVYRLPLRFRQRSTGHLFQSLVDASAKVLRIVKARYLSSSAVVTHANCDGAKGKSNVLAIRRGVLEGDICSPLLFCVCLYFPRP